MIVSPDWETVSPLVFYGLSRYRFNHWTASDIDSYHRSRLKQIVRFAYRCSPFFRQHYRGSDLNNFASLPPVNKQLMMDNFSLYNTLGLSKTEVLNFALRAESRRDFTSRFQGLNIGMSSGTLGNKGLLITTPREEKYLKALYLSRLVLPSGRLNCAFILRVNSPAFNFHFLGNSLNYVNQLQPLENIIQTLNHLHPNVISAPPSMLKILAQEKAAGRLKVSPELIYSYAEVLYPDVRSFLSQVFSCPLHQIYQGSEGCYALTCRKGNLHLNEDLVYFGLFNQDGTLTPTGSPCYRLLVTDLHKRSQPVIRYELNDIVTMAPGFCPCGSHFRVIQSIQGRADQLFWGKRKLSNRPQFIYPDYIARKIISVSEDIIDYQAIQNSYSEIIVKLQLNSRVLSSPVFKKIKTEIRSVFEAYDCVLPDVKVEIAVPEPNPRSRKLIRIMCNIKSPQI